MTAGPDQRSHAFAAAASLACLLGVLSSPVPPAAAAPLAAPATARLQAEPVDTLVAELTSLTPSALEVGENVELEGRVINGDDHAWRDAQAYLVISSNPLTTRAELAAEAEGPAESYFGERVTEIGRFDELGDLAAGETASFRITVPYRLLGISGASGVYTVGVQVLATNVDGTRQTAARARTFVPLLSDGDPARVRLAMVWPLHSPVLRRGDGTYARADRLIRATGSGGRLRRVVDLAGTAGSTPVTVVPDPAVLDATEDIGAGRFGPDGGVVTRMPTGGEPEAAAAARDLEGVASAASWFTDAVELADDTGWSTAYGVPSANTLATTPYPALAESVDAATLATGRRLLGQQLRVLRMPAGGTVDADTLAGLRQPDGLGSAALWPRMLPDWGLLDGSAVQVPTEFGALPVVVTDPALAAGGPAPGDQRSALQMLQRLLAETALISAEAEAAGRRTVSATFVAPSHWDPGPDWPAADFFTGLDAGWLDPVGLDELLDEARPYDGHTGVAPSAEPAAVELLPDDLTSAAAQLHRRAELLAQLVDGEPSLGDWYDAGVALGVSAAGTRDLSVRQRVIEQAVMSLHRTLRGVPLTGPEFVTLSSSRGRFPLTVSNQLDRSVTVSVSVETVPGGLDPSARFDSGSRLTIQSGDQDTVTVETRVGKVGVTSAEAYVVTETGRRVGAPLTFSMRTSVVGTVIWVIMGAASALLVFAVARRLWRRSRG